MQDYVKLWMDNEPRCSAFPASYGNNLLLGLSNESKMPGYRKGSIFCKTREGNYGSNKRRFAQKLAWKTWYFWQAKYWRPAAGSPCGRGAGRCCRGWWRSSPSPRPPRSSPSSSGGSTTRRGSAGARTPATSSPGTRCSWRSALFCLGSEQ